MKLNYFIAFKRLFGQERNKDILIHFLNDVLSLGNNAIVKKIKYLPTIQDPEAIAKKESVLDVMCEDQFGRKHIIEMQVSTTRGFVKRAQFYAARAYGRQLNKKGEYEQLKQVIFLAIANFTMFPEKKEYKSDHVILDKKSYEHDLKDFSFTFIELPKFKKKLKDCKTMLEKWTYFFKHAEETREDELEALVGKDDVIAKAYHEVNKTFWTEEEINAYEADEKRVWDNQAALAAAKDIGIEIGKAEGLQEGIEKGKAEGLREGIEKGKYEAALRMLSKGIVLDVIIDVTGLTASEIKRAKGSSKKLV